MDDRTYQRLSQSPIWAAQRAYFATQGPEAWSGGAVPHYVTSNPFIAAAFADVVVGFARDRARVAPAASDQPLYLVELGAGCGRLAYALVRALQAARLRRTFVYVMTDLAERTVAWWQAHPWLKPLADAGLVDFARFDVEADDRIELRVSGRTIAADQPVDDLVVIANYVFDSLPHDIFYCERGVLHECVTEDVALPPGIETAGFGAVDLAFERRPTEPAGYYDDPDQCAILDEYRRTLDGAAISFPTAGIAALDRLAPWTRGPLLLLSGDKGSAHLDGIAAVAEPGFAVHGSISMSVNYHAIGTWVTARGGTWMHAAHHHRSIDVCAFLLNAGLEHDETILAFDRSIARRGPDDFYALKTSLEKGYGQRSLGELLAFLRFSGFDAKLFLDCAPAVLARLDEGRATPAERRDLGLMLAHVWGAYFPIGETRDLAYALGVIAFRLGKIEEAREYFAVSLELHGEREDARHNFEVCERAAG
jgi:hypothetical protein